MKVRVERLEHRESTVVMFEFTDHEIRRAETLTSLGGRLRPPRIDFRRVFSNPCPRDWIQYVSWLTSEVD